jgi:hypothetical protein
VCPAAPLHPSDQEERPIILRSSSRIQVELPIHEHGKGVSGCQPGPRIRESRMRCNTCGKPELVEIRMTVGGEELMFRRCGKCESQGWEGAGGSLTLSHVLDRARAH